MRVIIAIMALLGTRPVLCKDTPGDFVTQAKSECHFLNGSERVRYVVRWSYNQRQVLHFDSDAGVFEADDMLGVPTAKSWNSQKDFLEQARAQVDRFCRFNYAFMEGLLGAGTAKPKVKVARTSNDDPKKPHRLVCNVYGFYPYDITINWFKNGQEELEALSSDLMQNGDWTGQILVMLETTVQHGDSFVCQVEHATLQEPTRREWKPESSESAKSKLVTGIVGFVLGGIFLILGIFFWLKSRKALPRFTGQPEGSDLMN